MLVKCEEKDSILGMAQSGLDIDRRFWSGEDEISGGKNPVAVTTLPCAAHLDEHGVCGVCGTYHLAVEVRGSLSEVSKILERARVSVTSVAVSGDGSGGDAEKLRAEVKALRQIVSEAYSHLGAACAQLLDTDDEIVVDHVKSAASILLSATLVRST